MCCSTNTNEKSVIDMDKNDILMAHREKLSAGLKSGSYKIDDIEHLMGEAIEQFKNELAANTQDIIDQTISVANIKECPDCNRTLKKTKQKGSL